MEALAAFLAIIFFLPLITGYAAHSYGRSFWIWFGLAMILPVVSLFVLAFLPDQAAIKNSQE